MPAEKPPGTRPRAGPVDAAGMPIADRDVSQPPIIRRAEVVAIALVGLLTISVMAVLYVAKGFFLPVVTAFIVGTMVSPAAGYLERHRIPRSVAAILIVTAVCGVLVLIVGLISAPLIEWTNRLPELGSMFKDKLHLFDRPLALWHQLQGLFGESSSLSTPMIRRLHWR